MGCGASEPSPLDEGSSGGVGGAAGSGGAAGALGTAGSGTAAGGGGSAGTGGAPRVGSTSGCGSPPPSNGKHEVVHGGEQRSFQLHVPKGYDPSQPTPLVLNFHGRTATALGEAAVAQELWSGLYAKGDSAGFIVVNPQGLTQNGEQTWNAGLCCSADKDRDDVGYVDAVIAQLEQTLCIDEKRIFATGISNGGFMSHRLACERANVFAAVAPVAAYNTMLTCNPSRAIPIISFNGTSDIIASYQWSVSSNQAWVTRNGCNPAPTPTFKNGDSHCNTYAGCNGGGQVVFCSVEGGGHTWPGGADFLSIGLGKTTKDLSANDAMWDFFQANALP
jgi:polyhydroxybutyrate depolymerase